MPDPVLIILHQEHSTPGRVGQALKHRGYALDIRRPRLGEPLPETMAHHSGAVLFGGPRSANDREDFIRRESDWLAVPLAEQKPFLGICLGAQLLVRQLGGRVYFHPEGKVEVGYYPIRPTELGRAMCGFWPDHVYQWHREGFDLPSGAALVAEGELFPVQAFRHGACAYAIQFHPSVDHAGPRATGAAGRQGARRPFRGPRRARFRHPRLADELPRSLDGPRFVRARRGGGVKRNRAIAVARAPTKWARNPGLFTRNPGFCFAPSGLGPSHRKAQADLAPTLAGTITGARLPSSSTALLMNSTPIASSFPMVSRSVMDRASRKHRSACSRK